MKVTASGGYDLMISVTVLALCLFSKLSQEESARQCEKAVEPVLKDQHVVLSQDGKQSYNRSSPMIFIGGVPKSGTTLMRIFLDLHQRIRCGPESHVFIDVLKLRYEWKHIDFLNKRNHAAGITQQMIDKAVSAFLLEVVATHGEPAHIICSKEPFLMTQGGYLAETFPNSKLIHMVRDGRAISHSLVSRKLEFPPFSPTDHKQNLKAWAKLAIGMDYICKQIGPARCKTVRYEDLVTDTEKVMREILAWIGVDWEPSILRHHENMNKVQTSKLETTADQVVKPVYQEAIAKWKGNIPQEVLEDHLVYSSALATFGYALYG